VFWKEATLSNSIAKTKLEVNVIVIKLIRRQVERALRLSGCEPLQIYYLPFSNNWLAKNGETYWNSLSGI
jgi:hypothetical protein